MKKYMMAALFALVFAVPGMAETSFAVSRLEMVSPEIDPALVQAILKAAAAQSEYSYDTLAQMYADGTATIDKITNGYRVTLSGGHAISVLEEIL